jgi:hypothetical protein
MRAGWRRAVAAVGLVLAVGMRAHAAFHFAVIDEVMSGCGADPTVQFVEIRMFFSGQTVVGGTRLTAFSCDGTTKNVLRLIPTNATLTNGMSGARWIIGSPNFQTAAGIAPDFVMSDSDPGIFRDCGQICWGAPVEGDFTPPDDPGSWDHTITTNYIDCVAYGPYTGPLDPGAGAILTSTPANDGTESLTRSGDTAFDNNFALAAPTPTNNAGAAGSLATCAGFTTTSTAPPGGGSTTSTTTSGGGSTSTTTTAPPILGGGPPKTDCFAEWRVTGATAITPAVRCTDNDPTCDRSADPGCVVRVQLCFNDAAAAIYGGKCTASPVTGFALSGNPDAQNAAAVGAALQDLPGVQSALVGVSFAPPLAALTCSDPIDLEVPLRVKGTKTKKGVRTLKSVATADKRDKDKLKILCIP